MKIIKESNDYAVVLKYPGEDSEKDMEPGLLCIHRLDKVAAGLLVYGKTKHGADQLSRQLQDKTMKKAYRIVIPGTLPEEEGNFTDLLFKDSRKQKMFPVKRKRAGVKEARLHYRVLKTVSLETANDSKSSDAVKPKEFQDVNPKDIPYANTEPVFLGNLKEKLMKPSKTDDSNSNVNDQLLSLLHVELETGRFHQIRAQFASRRFPLLGDRKYGSRIESPHLALFCNSLSFLDPDTKAPVNVELPLPEEFPWNLF